MVQVRRWILSRRIYTTPYPFSADASAGYVRGVYSIASQKPSSNYDLLYFKYSSSTELSSDKLYIYVLRQRVKTQRTAFNPRAADNRIESIGTRCGIR